MYEVRQMEAEELRIELQDNEWPYSGTDHDRQIVRAIAFDAPIWAIAL